MKVIVPIWRCSTRLHRLFLALTACTLLVFLAACNGNTPSSNATPTAIPSSGSVAVSQSPTPGVTPAPPGKPQAPTPGATVTTVPMPPTQTNCPQPIAQTGRAAVMRPLALGHHANVAYIFDEGTPLVPTFGELKRYDVTTANKTVIAHLTHTYISEAQVSADGQWLLFIANATAGAELQMVRMDGQGLQTLYCASPFTLHSAQWSPDQKSVVLTVDQVPGMRLLYLLTMSTGAVQQELVTNDRNVAFVVRTWIDNTRLYVIAASTSSPGPARTVSILDTKNGAQQTVNNLSPVIQGSQNQYCWDFDSDYNATKLVTSRCTFTFPAGSTGRGVQQGPSSVSTQPITGGSSQTILNTTNTAITQVRLLGYTSSHLLLTVENQNFGANLPVDTSQNGLWKVNTDGSNFTRLTTEATGSTSSLNLFTQYPWSNVSFDGTMYALQVTTSDKDPITTLEFGLVSGGAPTSFAFSHDISELAAVAGWTML